MHQMFGIIKMWAKLTMKLILIVAFYCPNDANFARNHTDILTLERENKRMLTGIFEGIEK